MLYRYANVLGLDTSKRSDLTAFADGTETSDWAAEAMSWAIAEGVFEGYGDGTVRPTGDASRAEVAAVIERMIKLIVK